ncbi:MAG: pyridoxal 5'-phosphate synthase glutaminase subunit PdxT [Planctomycetota bacterium]
MVGTIGLLALQGDFPSHEEVLAARGQGTRRVTRPDHLEGLTGLVLPGGESTTMLRLLHSEGMLAPLRRCLDTGLPVLATCAGLILLAREVHSPDQESLGVLDLAVDRNGYGRQVHSGVHPLSGRNGFPDCEGVFIRAPRIRATGPGLEVLATWAGDPALVRRGPILAATFHPELSDAHPAMDLFLHLVGPGP